MMFTETVLFLQHVRFIVVQTSQRLAHIGSVASGCRHSTRGFVMNQTRINTASLLASVSSAALTCFGQQANAADLALKAPPVAVAPSPSWTGCYIGAQVGWGWGRQHVSESRSTSSGGPTTTHAASNSFDSSGGLFGGQLGCNYQFQGNWVAGIQGFLAGSDINGKGNDPLNVILHDEGTLAIKTDWLASVTGRLGFTTDNNMTLWYAKGGVAWDHNQWDLQNANFFAGGQSPLVSETRTGWTVGLGVETVLWSPRWTGFVEGNYYDFQNGHTWMFSTSSTPGNTFIFTSGKQNIETVTIGINYKLTGP
jgi:outer membrane immunogenic protein